MVMTMMMVMVMMMPAWLAFRRTRVRRRFRGKRKQIGLRGRQEACAVRQRLAAQARLAPGAPAILTSSCRPVAEINLSSLYYFTF